MTVYCYIRISTDLQNCANQHFELETFVRKNNIIVDEYIEETISSRKPLSQRKLGKLLNKMPPNSTLITTEVSRLGRNMLEIMGILQQCLEKQCTIITVKENYRLGNDLNSKIMLFCFSLVAEIERQLISQRTRESLKRLKNEGKHLGRPYGLSYRKLKKKHCKIVELLTKGVSKSQIAQLMGCTWTTLHRYLQENRLT